MVNRIPSSGLARSTLESKVYTAYSFGLTGGVDETAKLLELRAHALANPGSTYMLDPVEYQSTTPKWLAEVQDITVYAYGASFRNLGAGTYGYSDMDCALYLGSGPPWHDSQGTGQINPANANSGELINDVAVGATMVTFVTAGHSTRYDVGDPIILNWFSRQGPSFPPNPGYFEFNEVSAVGSGTITLKYPARNAYKATALDDTSNANYLVSTGKARCLNLKRTGYTVAGRIEWHGGIGIDSGNATVPDYDGLLQIGGAMYVDVYGARFEGIGPQTVKRIRLYDSEFNGVYNEMDKVIERFEARNTKFKNLAQGTGIQNFYMRGGALHGACQIRAKNVELDGVHVHSQSASGSTRPQISMDVYPRDRVKIDNCVFYPDSNQAAAVQAGSNVAFTPDATTSTTMTINSGNAAFADVKQTVDTGSTISLASGSAEEFFIVEDISFDGSNNLILLGHHNLAAPTLGARNLWTTKRVEIGPNNRVVNPPAVFDLLRPGLGAWAPKHNGAGNSEELDAVFSMRAGRYRVVLVNAYLSDIRIDVSKAYTGSDAAGTLTLINQGLGGAHTYMIVNVKTAGVREIDNFATRGAESGDTLTAITEGLWCEELVLHLQGSGGTGIFTDAGADDLPKIKARVRGLKP